VTAGALLASPLPAADAAATAPPAHPAPAAEPRLGKIDFPNSGAAAAQPAFMRGALLLHSFEYEDAREAFQEARRIDPGFALAAWGEAMTYNHPLWAQQDRDAALAALATLAPTAAARREKAPTERERGYLDAVEILYGEGAKPERDVAYMEAMRRLHESNPGDLEAQAFYALSILGSVPERDFGTYMRAAAEAEEVFAKNPLHPGAVHYLIHSYDDPIHAPLGLRAARVYAQIAPAASHAQHMISHIYMALGAWDEVVAANTIAVAVSEDRLRRKGKPLSGRSHHALAWLEYGLLQQGRFAEARRTLDTMAADATDAASSETLWHYAQMRAAYIVADPTRDDAPPARPLPDVTVASIAADAFATGYRAVLAGDLTAARAAAEGLRGARATAQAAPHECGNKVYDGSNEKVDLEIAAIMLQQLEALVLSAEGKHDEAIALLEQAAVAEVARAMDFGPPAIVKPSNELLGDVLLARGRAADAKARFEQALARAPRRTLSVAGLARAAEQAGDAEAAREAHATLQQIWKGDDAALRRLSALAPVSAGGPK
jgi:tetratricopeptide (TPR) repeat protein